MKSSQKNLAALRSNIFLLYSVKAPRKRLKMQRKRTQFISSWSYQSISGAYAEHERY